jgi:hypothetical protein
MHKLIFTLFHLQEINSKFDYSSTRLQVQITQKKNLHISSTVFTKAKYDTHVKSFQIFNTKYYNEQNNQRKPMCI